MSVVQKFKCPVCGVEFDYALTQQLAEAYNRGEAVALSLTCPNGHAFATVLKKAEEELVDCEIRDWDRFAVLPPRQQQVVLEAIQSGRVSPSLRALLRRLRDAGIVICT
ncbi:MAG: hypothetical protein TU35_001935 [Thermoproteus sp. AZ2]|jgi:hypothetical protein|uniref:Uncharacterized protein n=1 Tax=Thermoproteus sp. AZ2 TaxID=1609232 RepID=A0ACC6UZB3_9CREN